MAQFARMGWDGLRLTFWGDWEASDSAGQPDRQRPSGPAGLPDRPRAGARHLHAVQPDPALQLELAGCAWGHDARPGFGRRFGKARMGTDPAAIAAQVNYLRQILEHVNPYTGVALKDEPAILFIELVNEPAHHPEDIEGSIRYINTLTDAVRSTGCRKLVFYNVSQDFRIAEAIRRSQGAGGHLRLVSHRAQLGPRAGRQLPPRSRCLPRHAAARAGRAAAHRVRVRQPRPRDRHDVSRDGAHLSRGGHAVRRHVRLRHAADRVAQPRLADPLPEPGLHAAKGHERDHRRRSDAPAAPDALVRRVSPEHPVRRFPRLLRRAIWASWSRGTPSCTRARRDPRRPTRPRSAGSPATARPPPWPTKEKGPTSSTRCVRGCGGSRSTPTPCRSAIRSSRPARTRS